MAAGGLWGVSLSERMNSFKNKQCYCLNGKVAEMEGDFLNWESDRFGIRSDFWQNLAQHTDGYEQHYYD